MDAADVVVVGSGSAGCALAARLAAGSDRTVLLLEAGPDLRQDPPPAMHDGWRTYREHDWGLVGEWRDGREDEPLHRGRLLGGTSWVTRFAMRGSPADYQQWVDLGNDGWSYDDVLPFFIRVENDLEYGDRDWHGDDGPLPITRYPDLEPSPFETAIFTAFAETGFDLVDDHNAPGAVGAGRMPRNGRDGLRATGADAYLPLVDGRPNFEVRADAEVAAVELDGDRATGVRLVDGTVISAGEVVLCAGTYGSPTILLRSGIGPADHLRDVGVPVQVDLAGVGENLADHPGADLDAGFRAATGEPRFFWLATFHSSLAAPDDPPDLALWSCDPFGEPAETSVDAILLTPRSRGSVRLRSADPTERPRITLPGLSEEDDVRRLLEGLERARRVVTHPALRQVCADPATELPGTEAERRQWLAREVWPFPHTVGTCAMGPSPATGAVVDAAGRVHGVANLRVVDASVIPTAPSGFPHLMSLMLAERIADLMLSGDG